MNRSVLKHLLTTIALLVVSTASVSAQTSTCDTGLAEAFLDVNNVRARIVNTGGLFWRGSPHVYEVPKYEGKHSIFAFSIWLAGKVDNQIRASASTYGPWQFWPGPLDEQGNPPADCAPYDRIFNIYQRDITEYDRTGLATDDLLNWPWELGAPVVDADGDPNNYNLTGGDRPEIMGHQTLWWVMNDRGNLHERPESFPIGLEVQVTAFSAASTNEHIDNTTLYRYKIKYKGDSPLEEAYFGAYLDIDLGNFADDYVGSDTTLGMAYGYNADNLDEGKYGYGEAPPAIGFDVLRGALVNNDGKDNDRDGVTDEIDERLSMTTFFVFDAGSGGVQGSAETADHVYSYLSGKWKDGKPFTLGGLGRDFSSIPASFMFSGNPVTGEGWTEFNPDPFNGTLPPIDPSDRQSAFGSGPFTIKPDEEQEIVFAVIWARGEDNLDSVTKLKETSVDIQTAFDTGFNIELPASEPLLPVRLAAPANEAEFQPINPMLHWQPDNRLLQYIIEWSNGPMFTNTIHQQVNPSSSFSIEALQPSSTYYWRVRPVDAGSKGPWSDTWHFTTSGFGVESPGIKGFLTTQNSAGIIDPPDMATFAFNNSGFPILEGSLTPVGIYPEPDRPTSGIQQSTNSAVWGILSGGSSCHFSPGDPFVMCELDTFDEFRRNAMGVESYEWRFPQHCFEQVDKIIEVNDCLAFRNYDANEKIEVPFELWNIGISSDTFDDFRMIPMICEETCSGGGSDSLIFDIGKDHPISGDLDDPYTDLIYWYNPLDNGASFGEQGYHEFFWEDSELGDLVFHRISLVQLDGGLAPPYDISLPEPGTVFRIAVGLIRPPFLSAPLDNEPLISRNASLFWSATQAKNHLQVDITPEFIAPIIDINNLDLSSFTTDELSDNQTYYWRVQFLAEDGSILSNWSETWQFTIPLNVDTESDTPNPLQFALEPSYPNPFSNTTRIRYALPESAEVHLEVFNMLGRRVRILQNQQQPAGWHEAAFDASNLSSGVYFYRLRAGDFTDTKTMVLMR